MGRSPFSLNDVPNPVKWKERWPKSQSYKPSEHDQERQRRREKVDGRFVGCRHYRREGDAHVCAKHGQIEACDCYTCPQCGGNLQRDAFRRTVGVVVYQVEAKVCIQCGGRIEDKAAPVPLPARKPAPAQAETPGNFPPRCAVSGCQRRTWEGYEFQGRRVCLRHAEKQELWELSGQCGHSPLVLEGGAVIENRELARASKARLQQSGRAGGTKPKKTGGSDEE